MSRQIQNLSVIGKELHAGHRIQQIFTLETKSVQCYCGAVAKLRCFFFPFLDGQLAVFWRSLVNGRISLKIEVLLCFVPDIYCIVALTYIAKNLRLNDHLYAALWKKRHCPCLSSFLIISFTYMWRGWSLNLTCRRTDVVDTYWATTAIPFKVEADNSWKTLCLYKHEK